MMRLVMGAACAIALWLAPGCDGSVDTNRTEGVTSGKEADDPGDAPTPLPRADGGADEGGDIPPAPTPDDGTEGEKPDPGGSGGGSGDSGGSGGSGGGCSGSGCGGSGGGCGSGGWSSGGCSF